jgi:long-chain acyl-CoA synthetase
MNLGHRALGRKWGPKWGAGKQGLEKGDRVAIMVRNCREWVVFDQAALGLGLVTVPH